MKPVRLFPSLLISAALALLLALVARAEETKSTIAFSQPEKTGTVKIRMARGTVDIQGADTAEVAVRSESAPLKKTARKDGLRVLSASSSFSLTEKENVVTLDAMGSSPAAPGARFNVTVPRSSSVIIQNSWGGDVICSGIKGNIEVTGTNGSIRLDDIAGGVVASTMNGEIRASVKELNEGKPLSFQSMNGEILLRLPSDLKANVRVRTQNGSVLTDFDEAVFVTKTESSPEHQIFHSTGVSSNQKLLTSEARDAIREAARASAEAVREATIAIREAAEAAREGVDAAKTAEGEPPRPPATPRAPRAPKAMTIPTITGGKIITGTLNSGGPDIYIATMNGDVTLRRAEKN